MVNIKMRCVVIITFIGEQNDNVLKLFPAQQSDMMSTRFISSIGLLVHVRMNFFM